MSDLKLTTAYLRLLHDPQCSQRARLHALRNSNPSKHCLAQLLADRRIRGKLREELTSRYAESVLRSEVLGKKAGRPPNVHVDRRKRSDAEVVN